MKAEEVLHISYSPQYILLSLVVGCCGAKAAVCMLDQARETRRKSSRRILELASGLTIGGVSFWGQAVILLSAMRVTDQSGTATQLHLSTTWALCALAVSLLSGLLSIQCGTRDSFFGLNKQDRVSLLETSLRKQKISELRANARAMIMQKALFSRLHYVMGAGLAISVGSEVCDLFLREALHGSYKLDYGAFGIVSSVVFSAMYSLVGGWMLFRLNQWKENWESLRLLSTLYLGTLQCAIFYFNCLTMTLESRNGEIVGDNTLHQVATQVTLATVIVVMLTFSYAIYDMRLNIYHFRSQADEHYKQLRQLHEDVPLIECKLEPGSVYMKGNTRSEVVKLEVILMQIESYLARFTTVKDSWTEQFYRDPSFSLGRIIDDFKAKHEQIIAQSRRSSAVRVSPLVTAIHVIQQSRHMHSPSSDGGSPSNGSSSPYRRSSAIFGVSSPDAASLAAALTGGVSFAAGGEGGGEGGGGESRPRGQSFRAGLAGLMSGKSFKVRTESGTPSSPPSSPTAAASTTGGSTTGGSVGGMTSRAAISTMTGTVSTSTARSASYRRTTTESTDRSSASGASTSSSDSDDDDDGEHDIEKPKRLTRQSDDNGDIEELAI